MAAEKLPEKEEEMINKIKSLETRLKKLEAKAFPPNHATLSFDLSDEHYEMKYKRMMAADDLFRAMSEFKEYLRYQDRYVEHEDIRDEYIGEIRDKFLECLNERGVEIDTLWY